MSRTHIHSVVPGTFPSHWSTAEADMGGLFPPPAPSSWRESDAVAEGSREGVLGRRKEGTFSSAPARPSFVALGLLLLCTAAAETPLDKTAPSARQKKAKGAAKWSARAPQTIGESEAVNVVFALGAYQHRPPIFNFAKGFITWDPPTQDTVAEIENRIQDDKVSLRFCSYSKLKESARLLLDLLAPLYGMEHGEKRLTNRTKIFFHRYETFQPPFDALLGLRPYTPGEPEDPSLPSQVQKLLQYSPGRRTHEALVILLRTERGHNLPRRMLALLSGVTISVVRRLKEKKNEKPSLFRPRRRIFNYHLEVTNKTKNGVIQHAEMLISEPITIRSKDEEIILNSRRVIGVEQSPKFFIPALGEDVEIHVTSDSTPDFEDGSHSFTISGLQSLTIAAGPRVFLEENNNFLRSKAETKRRKPKVRENDS